jgi:methyl-accepting chemotaxis protein
MLMRSSKRPRINHRRILVDSFQVRIVGVAVLHFLLVILIFSVALFAPSIMVLKTGAISLPHVQNAAHEFLILNTRVWAPLIGAFMLLVLHNLLVTHRIAGPLFRLRRYLEAVGGGDLSAPIRFRKGDYLQKEAEVASRMVASLRTRISAVEDRLDRLNEAWMDVRTSLGDDIADELERKLDALDECFGGCRTGIESFKTADERASSEPRATEPSAESVEVRV